MSVISPMLLRRLYLAVPEDCDADPRVRVVAARNDVAVRRSVVDAMSGLPDQAAALIDHEPLRDSGIELENKCDRFGGAEGLQ